jgi:tetratricopeptide (TPR) repeat protein
VSGGGPERRRAPLSVRLGVLGVSIGVALMAGVVLFSWVSDRRLDARLHAAVTQQAVSAETFNIYYFGESTMVGEPYAPQASIPQIVEYLLGGRVSGKPVRSVNLAQVGSDFRYSLERLKAVVRQRDVTHPSLFVIYGGHNEFLKYEGRIPHALFALPPAYSNLFQRVDALFPPLEADDRQLLDVGVVSPEERGEIIERYKSQMSEALALLKDNGIPVIVSTVAGNYADWEPNRSVFSGDARRSDEFVRLVARGKKLESSGDFEAAAEAYREALVICDSVAEVHYRLARCYRRLGQPTEAWDEFQRAVDADAMPMRATSAINDFIRTIGDGRTVATVDAVRYLRGDGAEGLIGSDLMIDAHHPNLKGYILISRLIASKIRESVAPGGGAVQALDESQAGKVFGIDQNKSFEVAISRGRWFTKLATWTYDPRERLQRAESFFRTALEIDPARYEPYLGLAMVQFLRGDAAGGENQAGHARTINPDGVDRYFREAWVRHVRERAHRVEDGKKRMSAARSTSD